jgi:hypothetical protein
MQNSNDFILIPDFDDYPPVVSFYAPPPFQHHGE